MVTAVTQVTEDHLVLVSGILYKQQVHVIVFHLVEMIDWRMFLTLLFVSMDSVLSYHCCRFLQNKFYGNLREQWQIGNYSASYS